MLGEERHLHPKILVDFGIGVPNIEVNIHGEKLIHTSTHALPQYSSNAFPLYSSNV